MAALVATIQAQLFLLPLSFFSSGVTNSIGRHQSGIVTVLFSNVIWSASGGEFEMGGTFAVVNAGAEPAVPPRGVVRTTWGGGSGVFRVRLAHIASIARMKYTCSGMKRES